MVSLDNYWFNEWTNFIYTIMRQTIKAMMFLGESEEVLYEPEVPCAIFYDTVEMIHKLPEGMQTQGTSIMTKTGTQYILTTPYEEIMEQVEYFQSSRSIFIN